jgi:hypothetical protein
MTTFSDAAWKDMHPAMWHFRTLALFTVEEELGEDLRITSGRRPATPGKSSAHPDGRAADIGIRHPDGTTWTEEETHRVHAKLARRAGEDFDVIVEGPYATDPKYKSKPPHIHGEYDPKGRHLNG